MRVLASIAAAVVLAAHADDGPRPLQGGIAFQSPEVKAMQSDAFANPGQLWVERGAAYWSKPKGASPSCAATSRGSSA